MLKLYCLLALSVLFFCVPAGADTVYLKNGRSLEGIVRNQEGTDIELEVCSGSIRLKKDEIEKVESRSEAENNSLRQKWERQKGETQDKIFRQKMEEESRPKGINFAADSQNIVLDAILNNKAKVSLVLDTGASLVVLRRNVAARLGINLERVNTEARLTLADGRQVNAKFIFLESVKIEKVEARGVEAVILLDESADTGLGDGLLGMSFLKKFNFKVDHKNKKLILEKL